MADITKSAIKKIKAKVGFHGVSDTDVLKAGNTAYNGLLKGKSFRRSNGSNQCRFCKRTDIPFRILKRPGTSVRVTITPIVFIFSQ
jgi:hypothetical protein